MANFRTSLSRVRGLGAARGGTEHFWRVRVTSVALVALTLFVLWLMSTVAGAGYDETRAMLATPWVTAGVIGFLLVSIYHMYLGMQEIILDYANAEGPKFALLLANIFLCIVLSGGVTLALIMIVLGG